MSALGACLSDQGRGSLYRISSSIIALHMGHVGSLPCLHASIITLDVAFMPTLGQRLSRPS